MTTERPLGRSAGGDRALATAFAELSKELMADHDETPTFERIVRRAVEVVPACDHSGVSLRAARHKVRTGASSSAVARACDELQYELGEGPCVEAVWDDEIYVAHDLTSDPRWPRWSRRAEAQGVRSVASVRLAGPDGTMGALNFYSERPFAFDEDDLELAVLYAAHATNAMQAARLVTGLSLAVSRRHVIGVAQGILMTAYDLTMEQAFEVLRRYSSASNIKVHDLAQQVISSRTLPDLDDLRQDDPTRRHPAAGTRTARRRGPTVEDPSARLGGMPD
jgi:GAF domain-containing protein